MNWSAVLFVVVAALLCWWTYRVVRTQKGAFTKENFSKTMGTLGVLALILIGFIALCVLLLRQSA